MENAQPALAQEPHARRQALIVDSSPEINQLLRNLFEEPEWNLRFVTDNQEALGVANAQQFDLIKIGRAHV